MNEDRKNIAFYLGREKLDESTRVVCDLLYRWANKKGINTSRLEFEAKIGKLMYDETTRYIPENIGSECFIRKIGRESELPGVYFEACVSGDAFGKVNSHMNSRCTHFIKNCPNEIPSVSFKRRNEVDLVVKTSPTSTIRVSVDPDDESTWIRAIDKIKGENLNFSCPHAQHDFRITPSYEKVVDVPQKNLVKIQKMRRKNRVSYNFGNYQIDITCVETIPYSKNGEPLDRELKRSHEIEIEIVTKDLLEEKNKLDNGQPNKFTEIGKDFLIAIRTLVDICNITIQAGNLGKRKSENEPGQSEPSQKKQKV